MKTGSYARIETGQTWVRFTLDGQGAIVSGSQSQVFKGLRSAT